MKTIALALVMAAALSTGTFVATQLTTASVTTPATTATDLS